VIAALTASAPGAALAQASAGPADAGVAAPAPPKVPGAAAAVDGGVSVPEGAAVSTGTSSEEDRIVEIRIEGNRRVEREAIVRALKNKVGQVFDREKTTEDLRALWGLNYFSDVQLLIQRLARPGIIYVIRVKERPAVREIKLEGNEELSRDDFKETIDLKAYSILDLDAVRRNAKKIQEKYVEKGYFLAEVTYRLDPVTPGARPSEAAPVGRRPPAPFVAPGTDVDQVDVVFVIREHAKVMVKTINLIGVTKAPVDDLKSVMFTKEGGYLSFITGEGTYREEIFQRDLTIIQAAYYDRGFINVKVEKPYIQISADKRYIFISIRIEEGEQFSIGKLEFSGELLVAREQLRRVMTTREGELFNRSKLSRDIGAFTDIYFDQGYAYANITPVTQVHPETRTVDLTFDFQKGNKVYIERIDITGNSKTRDKVIRREMRVYEGELFSGTGLRRSKERITALGFFETVEVNHKPGSDDTKVVVIVEIKEKATGTFQVGLGFSNVENFIFTAQVAQNNFLGWGQTASISLQLSSLRSFAQLSFLDPYFFDTNFVFSADLYKVSADFLGFIRDATGGDVNIGYHFLDDVIGNVTYTRERVKVDPGRGYDQIPLANRFRNGTTSSVRFSVTWDERNNRLFPSKGHLQFASAEFAPSFLGGTFLFARYTAYSRFYFPMPFGLVFKTNATLGVIESLDANSPVPVSELFFLGGINSVRGYLLRSITPTITVASSSRPDAPLVSNFGVGGNKQAILNLELEFPIFEKVGIKGVLFYDAGNSFAQDASFFQDKQHHLPLGMFQSVGFGFRWFSPIGPLRFEWGFPLNRRPIDQPVLFEFTIGNFF
jgi:outer membrane protein insertion porin family